MNNSNSTSTITIIPEKPNDLWLLFNLIANDDVVFATTTRKIQFSSHSTKNRKIQFSSDSTKKKSSSRVQVQLEIKITNVDYAKDCSIIRVRGKTITSNEYVNPGTFHTLELETKKEFKLTKKLWDEEMIRILKEGSNQNGKYDLGIILMKNTFAEILLVDNNATTITYCATIRNEKTSKNNSNLGKFFDNLLVSFRKHRKHIDMNVISYVVIASKDSIKDDFRAYLLLEAHKRKIKFIERNISCILMVNHNNIKDILSDKVVTNMNTNTKVHEQFMNMVINKSDWVCYGTKSVEYAHELLAIETLLITEELLENKDINLRKKYSKLKKLVQETGGKVVQFSDVERDRLAQMTGIAAILRFPIPNIDDLVL
ncbi:protein PELOTA 1-like [Solanum verrucosum]|uniref:protein PELOTA 1-like n=1 Tax=Solanum verrucosum TaxID=315347 RepID=UPI0020D0CF4C|nr:protein PELOTA 1-like [Solanum verrucosum]